MLTHIFICPLRYRPPQAAAAPPLTAPPPPTTQTLRPPSYVVPPRVLLRRRWLRSSWLRLQPLVSFSLRLPTHPLAGAGGFVGLVRLFFFDDFRTDVRHLSVFRPTIFGLRPTICATSGKCSAVLRNIFSFYTFRPPLCSVRKL